MDLFTYQSYQNYHCPLDYLMASSGGSTLAQEFQNSTNGASSLADPTHSLLASSILVTTISSQTSNLQNRGLEQQQQQQQQQQKLQVQLSEVLGQRSGQEIELRHSAVGKTTDERSSLASQWQNLDTPLEALSIEWQWPLIVLYTLTAVASLTLNGLTVFVLMKSRRTELTKYLISLSVSDLFMSLFSIPFTYTEYMLGRWVLHPSLCPVVRFVVVLSVFVSAATMTVIGINRHSAIVHPLGRQKVLAFCWLPWRKVHIIFAVWVAGILFAAPHYLSHAAESFCYRKRIYLACRSNWPSEVQANYVIFTFLCTYAVPLAVLSFLYTSIGLRMSRHKTPGEKDLQRDLMMQTTRTKVIKMLAVVVVVFALSWLPLQAFTLVDYLYPQIRNQVYGSTGYYVYIWTFFACHWLAMAHSCFNPLIYCFMNDRFCADLQNIVYRSRQLGSTTRNSNAGLNGSQMLNSRASNNRLSVKYQRPNQQSQSCIQLCTYHSNNRSESHLSDGHLNVDQNINLEQELNQNLSYPPSCSQLAHPSPAANQRNSRHQQIGKLLLVNASNQAAGSVLAGKQHQLTIVSSEQSKQPSVGDTLGQLV